MALLLRRGFLLHLAGLAPFPFLARRLHARAVAELEPRLLRALGGAVLPSELGDSGVERIVAGFERWVAGYREGVELVHGYGTAELRYSGPSPALRWTTQLRALAEGAAQVHRMPFERLNVAERQALVRKALESERVGGLPAVARATHVAVGLLAFFYALPEATDLAYGARIGPTTCRPLADSPRPPLPLARRS